jgi:hypothetical protein
MWSLYFIDALPFTDVNFQNGFLPQIFCVPHSKLHGDFFHLQECQSELKKKSQCGQSMKTSILVLETPFI